MKRLFLFLAVFCFISLVAAQTAEPIDVDISKAEVIFLAGVGGFGVLALTEIIKRFLKTTGIATVIVSVVISAAATIYYLVTAGGGFSILKFVIYTVVVTLAANGIYLFPRTRES